MAQNNPPLTHAHISSLFMRARASSGAGRASFGAKMALSPCLSLYFYFVCPCERSTCYKCWRYKFCISRRHLECNSERQPGARCVCATFSTTSLQSKDVQKMKFKKNTPGSYSHRGTTQNLERTQKKNDTLFHTWKTWRAALGCNWQNTKRKSTTYSIPRRKNAKPSQL